MGNCGESISIIDSKTSNKRINKIGNTFINAYIHHIYQCVDSIPTDLLDIIRSYYGKQFVNILKFSAAGNCEHLYLSALHDKNTCVEIIRNRIDEDQKKENKRGKSLSIHDKGFIFVTSQYEFKGTHCWRVYVCNPNRKSNIIWGVTQPAIHVRNDLESHVYGVSHSKLYCPSYNKFESVKKK
eukprot:867038_1